VFCAPNESGKTVLLEVIAQLFDPSPDITSLRALRSRPRPERSRVALALRDARGPVLLGADLDEGAYHLAEGHDLGALWAGESVAPERIRERLGLLAPGLYRTLLTSSRASVSSRIDLALQKMRERRQRAERAETSFWKAQQELEDLRSAIEPSSQVDPAQTPYEQRLRALEQLELRLRQAREAQQELSGLQEQMKRFAQLDERLSPELEAKALGYAERRRVHIERDRRLREKNIDLARARTASVWSSAWIWVTVGCSAAIGFSLYLVFPILALRKVDHPVAELAIAAVLLLFLLQYLGRKAWLAMRRHRLLRRAQREDAAFAEETAGVVELARVLEIDRPEALRDFVAQRRALREREVQIRERLAQSGPPEQIEVEITELCEQLASGDDSLEAQATEEPTSVRARLGTAERELREASKVIEESERIPRGSDAFDLGDDIECLLEAASQASASESVFVWSDAVALVGLYLQALSNRRYTGVQRRTEGVYVLERAGAKPQALEEVNETVLQLLRHAVQFALAERLALSRGLPLLLDDPFVGLDPERYDGAARSIRRLGAVQQVLLATTNPFFEKAADLVIKF